jgi:hypothetical protein
MERLSIRLYWDDIPGPSKTSRARNRILRQEESIPVQSAIISVILLAWCDAVHAYAHDVYCYATVQRSGGKVERVLGLQECTIHLSPVFVSDDSEYLLAAEFNQAIPEAGQATCVTDAYEPDVRVAWQAFVDGAKTDSCKVVMEPVPGAAAVQPTQ